MPTEMEPEQMVERYRGLVAQLDVATDEAHRTEIREAARRLRDRWREQPSRDGIWRTVNPAGRLAAWTRAI